MSWSNRRAAASDLKLSLTVVTLTGDEPTIGDAYDFENVRMLCVRRRRNPMDRFTALLSLCLSAVVMATPASGGYRLLQTIPIPGDDGWDHPTVDSDARRLYVPNSTLVGLNDDDARSWVGKIR